MQHTIHQAAQLITQADGILICAGAGMGVDSGLPDFRGALGVWNGLTSTTTDVEALGRASCFIDTPEIAWAFYGELITRWQHHIPHAGFPILQQLAIGKKHGLAVFTSNVDGHFQQAGYRAKYLLECHGSMRHLQCSYACSDHIWAADYRLFLQHQILPRCQRIARPNVLLFEDDYWLNQRWV